MNTVLQPWIQDYVVGIAEQFGADYFNAPRYAKWRTVQIIEVVVSLCNCGRTFVLTTTG
jgi:hypothetical protein